MPSTWRATDLVMPGLADLVAVFLPDGNVAPSYCCKRQTLAPFFQTARLSQLAMCCSQHAARYMLLSNGRRAARTTRRKLRRAATCDHKHDAPPRPVSLASKQL